MEKNSFVENSRFPKLLDGSYVNASCTRVMLADKYIKQVDSVTERKKADIMEL